MEAAAWPVRELLMDVRRGGREASSGSRSSGSASRITAVEGLNRGFVAPFPVPGVAAGVVGGEERSVPRRLCAAQPHSESGK